MYRKAPSPRKAKGVMARIREQMFALDPTCYYCGRRIVLPGVGRALENMATLDHKKPKSKGGRKASRHNLVLCCLVCNHEKADQTEEEYRIALHQTATNPK